MSGINDASIKKALSINLKRIMQERKMKNKDLAVLIGLSDSAISNYLAGNSGSRPDTLSKIAEALHVSIDELIRVPRATLVPQTTLREDSNTPVQYEVPLFSAILASSEQVYRKDNFDGIFSYPYPIYGDYNCYAVKIYNRLLSSSGINHGSLVLFAAETEVKSGQFAAVLLKDERKVVIRRVTFRKDKIILSTDETSVSYSNKETDPAIKILGRVISATFSPNV